MTAAENNDMRAANLNAACLSSSGGLHDIRNTSYAPTPALHAVFSAQYSQQRIVAVEVVCEQSAREHELELLEGMTRECRDERRHVWERVHPLRAENYWDNDSVKAAGGACTEGGRRGGEPQAVRTVELNVLKPRARHDRRRHTRTFTCLCYAPVSFV